MAVFGLVVLRYKYTNSYFIRYQKKLCRDNEKKAGKYLILKKINVILHSQIKFKKQKAVKRLYLPTREASKRPAAKQ
jgi:hypothetical protein